MSDDEFPLIITDTQGHVVEFASPGRIGRFLEDERQQWSWLDDAPTAPVDMRSSYLNVYGTLAEWLASFEAGNWDFPTLRNHYRNVYNNDPPQLIFADSPWGMNVQMIREHAGDAVAYTALVLLTRRRAPNLADPVDFRAWQLATTPGLVKPDAWLIEQQRKIGSARQALRREIDRFAEESAVVQSRYEQANTDDRDRYLRLFRAGVKIASRRATKFRGEADHEITRISDTQRAYEVLMQLKAPVDYWKTKKTDHEKSAGRWGKFLAAYFLIATLVVFLALRWAWGTIGNDALSGKHFLMVAGVGAFLTLVFWIARLAVRIYLGERHLYTDAEERRVMTQAYLALIKDGAASEQERIVILSALFRSAQDGIVKEDNVGDVGLPAMIARMLDARR